VSEIPPDPAQSLRAHEYRDACVAGAVTILRAWVGTTAAAEEGAGVFATSGADVAGISTNINSFFAVKIQISVLVIITTNECHTPNIFFAEFPRENPRTNTANTKIKMIS
jgi:hypothetical protein